MKFTLKLQLDSAQELATFIQDMNMEIDLPFLDTSKTNEQVLQNLTKTIVNYELKIQSLETQLENSIKSNIQAFENYLVETMPPVNTQSECPAVAEIKNHFFENMDSSNNERRGMSIVANLKSNPIPHANTNEPAPPEPEETKTQTSKSIKETVNQPQQIAPEPTTNTEARTCQVCGKDVPPAKKAPFCSPRCYGTNYAMEHSSKKVKSPSPTPG